MNPLSTLETLAKSKHSNLFVIVGAAHDFNRIIAQDYQVTYPVMFIQKEINPVGTLIHGKALRESVELIIYFMVNPEQLDVEVEKQREEVDRMKKEARAFILNLNQDDRINQDFQEITSYNITDIYFNQQFTMFGAQLRFTMNYKPDYSIC